MAGNRDAQPCATDLSSAVWNHLGRIAFRTRSEPHRKRAKYSNENTVDCVGFGTPADSYTRKSTCSEDLDENCSEEPQNCLDHDPMVRAGSIPVTHPPDPPESVASETITAEVSVPASENTTPRPSQSSRDAVTVLHGLKIYHREVDRSVTDRFDDVSKQIEPALVHYLHKKRVAFRPLAIQLLVLGATEEVAKPWVVVLCPAGAKKKVQDFFRKDFAVRICHGPPSCQTRFDTLVIGRPLRTLGRENPDEVFVEQDCPAFANTWTPQTKVSHDDGALCATIGGFICVLDSSGEKSFYGLTAGHILPSHQKPERNLLEASDVTSDTGNSDTESDSDSISQHCSGSDEESSFCIDLHFAKDENSCVNMDVDSLPTYIKPEARRQWVSLGTMSPASYSARARDRDWALTHITAVQEGRLKLLELPFRLLPKPVRPEGDQNAVIDNKVTVPCGISELPARVLLPSGQNFVDVRVLRLHSNERLVKGASGSWIVNYDLQMRVSVYGMLIATDPFGSFWMMPMTDILADIYKELGAAEVHLANHDEIPIRSELNTPDPYDLKNSLKAKQEVIKGAAYFATSKTAFPKWASTSGPPENILGSKVLQPQEYPKRLLPE